MLNAAAPYRRDNRSPLRVPVVMPLIEVSVDAEGNLQVQVDREPYVTQTVLGRRELKETLEAIATDLGTPVRVEVREADGSTFTDILTPSSPSHRTSVEPTPVDLMHEPTPIGVSAQWPDRPMKQVRVVSSGAFGDVHCEGFSPSEEVAVAVVVAHRVAGDDGTARLRIPPAILAAHGGSILLVGTTSGAVALRAGAPTASES